MPSATEAVLLTHTPALRGLYYGDRALAALRGLARVVLHERDTPLTPPELAEAAAQTPIILSDGMTPVPAEVFAALPGLRAVLRCAVDIRNIDAEAASRAGVLVTRARPGFVASVTELAAGFLVDLARGISRDAAEYRAGRVPPQRMGRQLAGATLGIAGYGSIGRNLARVAAALGMSVVVADPYVTLDDPAVRHAGFEDMLAAADYVVCLVVANAATENLFDAAAFARMRRGAAFLNLSRGNLVDEAALEQALRSGHLAAAAMDVGRAAGQMPTPALAGMPNVTATPHIGGLTPQAVEAQAMDTVAQVETLLAGGVPHGAVNAPEWRRRAG